MDLRKYVEEMRKIGLYRETRKDYVVMCPECYKRHKGDPKYKKLHLYIDKSYGYGQCFRDSLVVVDEDQSLNFRVNGLNEPDLDMDSWKVYRLNQEGESGFWTLDRFNTFDEYDEEGVNYLVHKRLYLYRQLYKLLGIRFYQHNPVVPFYYHGELVYYQIRIIDPNSKIKYFSPKVNHKSPYIIENDVNKVFVVVEGTFDAIAEKIMHKDWTPFAVLGSSITKYQIGMLRSYVPDKIYIQMDETEISVKIKQQIEQYIDYADIEIIPSNGIDPEELLKQKIMLSSEEF